VNIVNKLIELADKLDNAGLIKEADKLNELIIYASRPRSKHDTELIRLPKSLDSRDWDDVGISVRLENAKQIANEVLNQAYDKINRILKRQGYEAYEIDKVLDDLL